MQAANQARAKPSQPGAGAPVDDAKVRSVYDAYVAARKSNNERTDNVSIDSFGKNLRDMAPKFRAKFGRDVDFDVVVVDGKVGIKPKPGA